jgi:hypothetical protein
MNETWQCHHCDNVIGVYEPMVVLIDGRTRNTSRAAERDHEPLAGECYHHTCYALLYGDAPSR